MVLTATNPKKAKNRTNKKHPPQRNRGVPIIKQQLKKSAQPGAPKDMMTTRQIMSHRRQIIAKKKKMTRLKIPKILMIRQILINPKNLIKKVRKIRKRIKKGMKVAAQNRLKPKVLPGIRVVKGIRKKIKSPNLRIKVKIRVKKIKNLNLRIKRAGVS